MNEALIAEVMARNSAKSQENATEADQPISRDHVTQCLLEATRNVFSTMCGMEAEAAGKSASGPGTRYDVSGIIGLSGETKATIVVSLQSDVIYQVAENMLGMRPSSLDSDVVDLVGELANMIGGNAKERLKHDSLALGLPTVVAGEGHFVAYGSGMSVSSMQFETDAGSFTLELGMAE